MFNILYRFTGIILLVSLLMLFTSSPVLAFEVRQGDTVTIASGEVVNDDLYFAGGDIVIDGTVNGDIFAVGRSITINGKVNGGVSFGGQTATINGEITNGLRFGGQTIIMNGRIGRDLVVGCSQLSVLSTGRVDGDLIFGAGTAQVNGTIGDSILGGVGEVTLTNNVGGDIALTVDRLAITSSAVIQGNLKYTSPNEASIQSGAIISGDISHLIPDKPEKAEMAKGIMAGIFGVIVWKILSYVMIFIIGIILILIVKKRMTLIQTAIQKSPWQTLGWGALILIATPIAAIIVMITVVGLPLGIISLLLWGIALYLCQVPVALLLGRLIIRQNRALDSTGIMIGALALGLLILFVLRLIPIIGWIVGLLVVLFGLGALITSSVTMRFESAESN
ncbi:polymer-forming cytoskeletal protein [Chloroflexota bacterium]